MASNDDLQREITVLAERIRRLRALQHSQQHLPFVANHLQEHIDKLEARISELVARRIAS